MIPTHARTLVFFVVVVFGAAALLTATPSGAQTDLPGPTYRITGSVARDDAAVSGAAVSLLDSDGDSVAEATTDNAGNYAFSGVSAGSYRASAVHECCFRKSVAVDAKGLEMNIQAPAISLTKKEPVASEDPVLLQGIAKDKQTGKGVPNVVLEIQSYFGGDCSGPDCLSYAQTQFFTVESDADGRFELQINRGTAYLYAYRQGYDRTYGPVNATKDSEIEVPMRPTDGKMTTLTGVVKDTAGKPLAGAYVYANLDYSRSDGCPPNADCAATAVMPAPPMKREMDGGWTHESTSRTHNESKAGSDGSWSMQIVPGRLRVVAHAPEHIEDAQTVEAKEGQTHTVAHALRPIPPDSVTVRGKVTDTAGKALANAYVQLENQEWGSYAGTSTDSGGNFEVKTKPGYTVLTAAHHGGRYCVAPAEDRPAGSGTAAGTVAPSACQPEEDPKEYMTVVRTFVAVEGQDERFDLALRARPDPGAEFLGYVLNGTQGVSGAVVTFYNELTRDWGQASTDEDGSYRIKVRGGYYTIRAWAPGFFDAAFNTELGDKESKRLDIDMVAGQKRYGYYTMYSADHSGAPAAEMALGGGGTARASSGPSLPSDGQQAFQGEGGKLGPYRAPSPGGQAPNVALVATLAMAAIALVLRRRD